MVPPPGVMIAGYYDLKRYTLDITDSSLKQQLSMRLIYSRVYVNNNSMIMFLDGCHDGV